LSGAIPVSAPSRTMPGSATPIPAQASRGEPPLENEISRVTNLMLRGQINPEAAATEIQSGLDKWYKPRGR